MYFYHICLLGCLVSWGVLCISKGCFGHVIQMYFYHICLLGCLVGQLTCDKSRYSCIGFIWLFLLINESIEGYGEIVAVTFLGLAFLVLLGRLCLYRSPPCFDGIAASKGYALPPFLMNGPSVLNDERMLYTHSPVSRFR